MVRNTMETSQTIEVATGSRRATYQDVLDAPPHKVAEIVDGQLYLSPRPAPIYAVAKSGLSGLIGYHFLQMDRDSRPWWIIHEPEIHLCADIVVPDITGWRRERLPLIPNVAYMTLPPDWVCEVLSPITRKLDLGAKLPVYAREGVKHIWLVDPDARSLEVFELRGTEWFLIDTLFDDAPVSLPPFEEVDLNLGDLWPTRGVQKELPSEPTDKPEPTMTQKSK